MQGEFKSRSVRVRILPSATKFWSRYIGQECEAIIYEGGIDPQINSEQLTPPVPKWQTIDRRHIEVIDGK